VKLVRRLIGAAGAITLTAIAGWCVPVIAGSIVLAVTLIAMWILSNEKRTQRTVDIINAIRNHKSTGSG
jgi:hypothetical protein